MQFLLALVVGITLAAAGRPAPYIVRQQSVMVMHDDASPTWERHIVVRNPRNEAIWFWIECESQLTSVAIGQAGRRTSEYVFPDIPPGEKCMIHHWQVQRGTQPPKEWRP